MKWNLEGATVEELLEMAAMVEQSGFDFYARLSARTDGLRMRNELKFLRDEEALHKAFFLEQLRARGGVPRGAVGSVLQDALQREFFGPVDRMFASPDARDADKALRLGEDLEQKSIDFYGQLLTALDTAQRAALEDIISQEESHRRKLGLIRGYSS